MQNKNYLSLDIGTKRIGVAVALSGVTIAQPLTTLDVDSNEKNKIIDIIKDLKIDLVVVGYPRNQKGELSEQTRFTEKFIASLRNDLPKIVFQDESLTSVLAEEALKTIGKPYKKSDIDSKAAAIILQDYLELHNV